MMHYWLSVLPYPEITNNIYSNIIYTRPQPLYLKMIGKLGAG
jgi:hypothetical protein